MSIPCLRTDSDNLNVCSLKIYTHKKNGNGITKFSEIFSQSPFNPTSSVPEAAKALSFDKNHFCFDFFNIDFLAFVKL